MAIASNRPDILLYFLDHIRHLKDIAPSSAEIQAITDLYNQRACGTFFMAHDQKDYWTDTLSQEEFRLGVSTNYEG